MTEKFRYRLELFMLFALILFLPLLESPKNISWLLFVLTWFFNRIKDRDFGGRWDAWDSFIAVWILSGIIVAFFSGFHYKEWSGAWDLLRYGLVLWLVKRAGYDERHMRWLLITVVISTFIALIYAYWSLYVTHTRNALELHSVGHVNHSAIYLVISFGLVLAGLLAYWNKLSVVWRFFSTILTMFIAYSVFVSASRAAVVVMMLLTFILSIVWLRRSRYPLIILTGAVVLAGTAAFFLDTEVVKKTEFNISSNNITSNRVQLWRSAVVAWRQFPVFGVGMSNYSRITMERVKKWVEDSGETYKDSEYLGSSHGHSLYVTALAERGVFGFAILLGVLLIWLYWLVRFSPRKGDSEISWVLWGGSFSAWFVTVGAGVLNTTLHHEHALLSVFLLGVWLSYLKLEKESPPTTRESV